MPSTVAPGLHRGPQQTAEFDDLPSPTCGKVLAMLELLAAHPDGITAAAAARRSGITSNLVFRILKTLVARGFCIQQPETKAYRLSSRLLELASPQVGDASLAVVAYGPLCQLRDATGETAQLVIESAGKALVLEQVQGTQPLQVCGQVGMRTPLYSSAPGKAILAWWGGHQRAAWFRSHRLKRFTAATLADRPSLLADLTRSRDRGYTVDLAEGNEGIHCVAAPVLDPYSQPVAAVTIMAPVSRLGDETIPTAAIACKAAAAAIEAALAGRSAPQS